MARYAVTGGTGFVGGEVARQLLADGHEVVAVVRAPERAGRLEQQGAVLRRGDVTERETLGPAFAGADGIFHLAAWYRIGRRDPRAEAINVAGTRNVIEAAWRSGVGKIVHTSTLAVLSDTGGAVLDESHRHLGPHLSEYDRTKWMAHHQVAEPLAESGAPVVIVQPGVVYGLGDTSAMGRLLRDYLRRRLPAVPRGSAYCWGHVEDTARGHLLAMKRGKPGESYIIAGPPHTLAGALRIAESVTGIPSPRLLVPAAPLRGASAVLGMAGRVVPALRGPAELLGLAGVTYLGDSSKAERDLGFSARSLEDGFEDVLPAMVAELTRGR